MIWPRAGAAMVECGSRLYVVGGADQDMNPLADTEILDPLSGR